VERLDTHKGQAVTHTGLRTGPLVTQPLVVTLRTLRPAVTHVVRVKTDTRIQTAIEAWTGEGLTLQLILVVQAVKVAVTACVHRQAQTRLADTEVVGLWTRVVVHRLLREIAVPVKMNNGRENR
jgi:hypothetical protein